MKLRNAAIPLVALCVATALARGFQDAGEPRQEKAATKADSSPLRSKDLAEVPATLSDRPEDEKAVRAVVRALVEAYNARKAEAIAPLLAENALLLDADGSETEGRQAIADSYKVSFEAGETHKLQGTVEAIRFDGPDHASLRGQFQLLESSGTPASIGRFRIAAHREGEKWLVREIQDYAVEQLDSGSNYHQLRQLEWMVGDWIDESQDVRVSTQVRWDDHHNFLIRTYEMELAGVPASSGTQIIGWDPHKQHIRSWVFDSLGGFGEGVWHSQGNRWLIKSHGVMRNGQTTTSTQVIEIVNDHAVHLSSYDRTAGDESLDDVSEILMVRKAPEPTAADPTKAATEPAAAKP